MGITVCTSKNCLAVYLLVLYFTEANYFTNGQDEICYAKKWDLYVKFHLEQRVILFLGLAT